MESTSHLTDEKHGQHSTMDHSPLKPGDEVVVEELPIPNRFQAWNARIEALAGFEARGITRVDPEERQPPSAFNYVQMGLIWFSANVTVNNLALGLLGPLVYDLGFTDSALCAVFGCLVGSMGASVMSVWGPKSGNRTLVRHSYSPSDDHDER